MKNFTDRVAAITGAGSGMGRSLAIALARDGCHLSLADRNATSLAETAQLAQAAAPNVVGAPLRITTPAEQLLRRQPMPLCGGLAEGQKDPQLIAELRQRLEIDAAALSTGFGAVSTGPRRHSAPSPGLSHFVVPATADRAIR